ncbi:MAG: acetylserotonin O-methyltransferase [Cytophagales bacterium]|nr:acetylserotonin O-methyltransferase [Cytophagales bacterium]
MIHRFNFIEKILLNRNIIPHPLMDVAANVGLAKALGVAVKLKITEQLDGTEKTAAQIAQACAVSEKGTEIILDCLEAMGYVDKNGNGYRFNKRGAKFLDRHSPDSFCYFILFCDWAYQSFLTLEETVVQGRQLRTNLEYFGEHEWELFSRAMTELARTNLAEVVGKIRLPEKASRLIDLGGSHGLYSIELCKKYPTLSAEVVDFEPVRKYANENIEKYSMQNRVVFKASDFMKEAIPTGYDAALLFQIIHGNTTEANRNLFRKIAAALNPGGQLIILEQVKGIGGDSQLSKANTSFMALNLFHQSSGNTYTFGEVSDWAKEAGFRRQQLKKLNAPGFGLIICEK